VFTSHGGVPEDRDLLEAPVLGRPFAADAHRRELLARLPGEIAEMLTEPLGPLGLAGAAVPAARHEGDRRTALLLPNFAQRDALPEWVFGR